MYRIEKNNETRLDVLKDSLFAFLLLLGLCLGTTMDFFHIIDMIDNVLAILWFLLSIFSFINCILLPLAIIVFYICSWRKHFLTERIGIGTIIGLWIQFIVYSILTIRTFVIKFNSFSVFIHLVNIVLCLGILLMLIMYERKVRQINVVKESV